MTIPQIKNFLWEKYGIDIIARTVATNYYRTRERLSKLL
jgi:hypothetical protein